MYAELAEVADTPAGTAAETPADTARRRGRRITVGSGSAYVVAVAYVDPGNFAINSVSGARFGFLLLWVVVAASVMAMFVQYLSARLGAGSGRDLAQLCHDHFPRPVVLGLWLQAEVCCMATDLAEFVGTAVALQLLFGTPLLVGIVIAAAVSTGVLTLSGRHRRRYELVIVALLAVVLLAFLYQAVVAGGISGLAAGMVPHLGGRESSLLAVGIVGATVMPHTIYLHSTLTATRRNRGVAPQQVVRQERSSILFALGLAGIVNVLMLVTAAKVFHGHPVPASLHDVSVGLRQWVGPAAAVVFALALLAAGLASSSVGTQAGDAVMAGFATRTLSPLTRRLVTVAVPVALLVGGIDATSALVMSQVVLSFGVPFVVVPLVLLLRRPAVMGALATGPVVTTAGVAVCLLLVGLNAFLVLQYVL